MQSQQHQISPNIQGNKSTQSLQQIQSSPPQPMLSQNSGSPRPRRDSPTSSPPRTIQDGGSGATSNDSLAFSKHDTDTMQEQFSSPATLHPVQQDSIVTPPVTRVDEDDNSPLNMNLNSDSQSVSKGPAELKHDRQSSEDDTFFSLKQTDEKEPSPKDLATPCFYAASNRIRTEIPLIKPSGRFSQNRVNEERKDASTNEVNFQQEQKHRSWDANSTAQFPAPATWSDAIQDKNKNISKKSTMEMVDYGQIVKPKKTDSSAVKRGSLTPQKKLSFRSKIQGIEPILVWDDMTDDNNQTKQSPVTEGHICEKEQMHRQNPYSPLNNNNVYSYPQQIMKERMKYSRSNLSPEDQYKQPLSDEQNMPIPSVQMIKQLSKSDKVQCQNLANAICNIDSINPSPMSSNNGPYNINNNKQNGRSINKTTTDLLNLEKCQQASDSSSFADDYEDNDSSAYRLQKEFDDDEEEEKKDRIHDIQPRVSDAAVHNTIQSGSYEWTMGKSDLMKMIITKQQKPHSSNCLIHQKTEPQGVRTRNRQRGDNGRDRGDSFFKIDSRSHNDDISLQFENPPLRRSNSMEKRAVLDLGRSPQNPFVQNYRTSLKRNSSQRLHNRRNFSPYDHTAENSEQLRRASLGKSQNDSARKGKRQRDITSSIEKASHSQKSSSTTPLKPQDVFKKYEDFPDQSLKVSVYKEVSMQIIQAINIIQQIKQFPKIHAKDQIKFEFKKTGFNKLLIFDLDETLIHSKRDEDELEFEELLGHYIEAEPDEWVQMESPTGDYGPFDQGIFVRPYLHECLRAANTDYEVAVFTAGYDWYANPIIDKIDPSGTLIQHRFFRQHAQTITHKGQESLYKDLSVLKGIDLSRTLIIDNHVFSFATNLSNGIPIASYYGSKKDCELIKVMKYVHQIAQEENLIVANESQFQLRSMLDTPISKFVQYYQIDEMSESDENDFEEDGKTMQDSPRQQMQIYNREDEESQNAIQVEDSDEEIQLNYSFDREERASRNHRSHQHQTEQENPRMAQTQLLRLQPLPNSGVNENEPIESPNLFRNYSFQPQQQIRQNLGGQGDNQYTLISKQDEGNIGGTLSTQLDQQNSLERNNGEEGRSPGVGAVIQNQSPFGQQDHSSQDIITFTDVFRNENEHSPLRVPQVNEVIEELNISGDQENSPEQVRSARGKTQQKQKLTSDVAPSSYYQVSLSTEKAKRRQSSLGQRNNESLSNAQQSFYTPLSLPKISPLSHLQNQKFLKNPLPKSNHSLMTAETRNNELQFLQAPNMIKNLSAHANGAAEERKGSDSYRGLGLMPIKEQDQTSATGKEPFTFADIVEKQQKTLTSVKKTQKIGMVSADNSSTASPALGGHRYKKSAAPSQSFLAKVVSNVNNTLKPPNWTIRKHHIKKNCNSQYTPSCATNIDYHLEQLSNIYKESAQKARDGTETSLMEQLLEANPSNVSFLTPNSSSQVTMSKLSEHKQHLNHLGGSISVDKFDNYQNLKNEINNQQQAQRKTLKAQKSANMAIYGVTNHTLGSEYQSSGGRSSHQVTIAADKSTSFQLKPQKIAMNTVGQGLLPPRPGPPSTKNKNMQNKASKLEESSFIAKQRSDNTPEKAREKVTPLEEELESAEMRPVGPFFQQTREEIKEKTIDSLFDNSLKDNDEGQ